MTWTVLFTEQFEEWFLTLSEKQQISLTAAIDQLTDRGPALGRPTVDSIKGSRYKNMKELRSFGGHLRALFAFDPKRHAIVLIGGDKSGNWQGWYKQNIPSADDLYEQHLLDLEDQE